MPCVGGGNVSAQIRSIYVTVDATDASIREVLESIESQSDLRFVYPDEVKPILTKVVTVSEKNISANRILDQILPAPVSSIRSAARRSASTKPPAVRATSPRRSAAR